MELAWKDQNVVLLMVTGKDSERCSINDNSGNREGFRTLFYL